MSKEASETLINLYADYSRFDELERAIKKLVDWNNYDQELLELT